MEKILGGLTGGIVYFDDILIFRKTMAEHDENLDNVFKRLEDDNSLSISYEKCSFARKR